MRCLICTKLQCISGYQCAAEVVGSSPTDSSWHKQQPVICILQCFGWLNDFQLQFNIYHSFICKPCQTLDINQISTFSQHCIAFICFYPLWNQAEFDTRVDWFSLVCKYSDLFCTVWWWMKSFWHFFAIKTIVIVKPINQNVAESTFCFGSWIYITHEVMNHVCFPTVHIIIIFGYVMQILR